MAEIYYESPVRAIGKVLLMKLKHQLKHQLKHTKVMKNGLCL